MTREEIITALRCCVSYDDNDCKLCPLLTNTECLIALKTAVVDLIENQQRRIEALMKANDSLKDAIARRDKQIAVRCRECKHCDHPMGTASPLRRKPDDFCSYGERKEGADND